MKLQNSVCSLIEELDIKDAEIMFLQEEKIDSDTYISILEDRLNELNGLMETIADITQV